MNQMKIDNPAQYRDYYEGVPETCIRSEFCAKNYYSEYGLEKEFNGVMY